LSSESSASSSQTDSMPSNWPCLSCLDLSTSSSFLPVTWWYLPLHSNLYS
jgi:hypothetical protein